MSYPNVAFIGKAGAGKDTAAALLIEHLDYRRVAFADKLKDTAAELWGEEARTDRDKLQRLGQAVREIDEDTWVNLALSSLTEGRVLDAAPGSPVRIADNKPMLTLPHPSAITDCRYRNEAWALKGEGFVVIRVTCDRNERINRLRANGKLGPSGWEDHISETDLDDWPEDYTLNNDARTTKADLLDQLVSILRQEAGQEAP